jgi:hypothetical protein
MHIVVPDVGDPTPIPLSDAMQASRAGAIPALGVRVQLAVYAEADLRPG